MPWSQPPAVAPRVKTLKSNKSKQNRARLLINLLSNSFQTSSKLNNQNKSAPNSKNKKLPSKILFWSLIRKHIRTKKSARRWLKHRNLKNKKKRAQEMTIHKNRNARESTSRSTFKIRRLFLKTRLRKSNAINAIGRLKHCLACKCTLLLSTTPFRRIVNLPQKFRRKAKPRSKVILAERPVTLIQKLYTKRTQALNFKLAPSQSKTPKRTQTKLISVRSKPIRRR